jgi:hypothetical protein
MNNVKPALSTFDFSDLEKFLKINSKSITPYVSIIKTKNMLFNKCFKEIAKNELLNKTHCNLFFSRKMNAIVFEFLDKKSEFSYKINEKSIQFSLGGFVQTYGINIEDIKGKYIPKLIDIPKIGKRWVLFFDDKISLIK